MNEDLFGLFYRAISKALLKLSIIADVPKGLSKNASTNDDVAYKFLHFLSLYVQPTQWRPLLPDSCKEK